MYGGAVGHVTASGWGLLVAPRRQELLVVRFRPMLLAVQSVFQAGITLASGFHRVCVAHDFNEVDLL